MKKYIRILENGPYEVCADVKMKNAIIKIGDKDESLDWETGREYPDADMPYCLCRCGGSERKPYCDGSHMFNGFKGEETAKTDSYCGSEPVVYEGETLKLLDYEELCASLRFCTTAQTVWDAVENSGDAEMRALAIKEANDCGAGRLVLIDKPSGKYIEPELEAEICPVQDTANSCRGPLYVKGGIELRGAGGKIYEQRGRMTLCRCGKSSNMPFCDASHLSCPHMQGSDER